MRLKSRRIGWVQGLVIALLAFQLFMAWASVSFDGFGLEWSYLSLFCTASREAAWQWLGWIHFVYLALFLFGCVSLAWPKGRKFYLILLPLSLVALPVQLMLLERNILYCDGP